MYIFALNLPTLQLLRSCAYKTKVSSITGIICNRIQRQDLPFRLQSIGVKNIVLTIRLFKSVKFKNCLIKTNTAILQTTFFYMQMPPLATGPDWSHSNVHYKSSCKLA